LPLSVRHSDACNLIHLAISELGGRSIPYTVGRFRALDSERVIKVGQDGTADILACVRGRFVAVEVKVDRDPQRDDQKIFQAAFEKAGGLYVLARFTDRGEDGVATLQRALLDIPQPRKS
jgi:hypothetical protein